VLVAKEMAVCWSRQSLLSALFVAATVVAMACAPSQGGAAQPAAGQATAAGRSDPSADPQQLLQELIARAKQEGALNTTMRSQIGPVVPQAIEAFKKRFGLDINVQVEAKPQETQYFEQTKAAIQMGVSPPFDTLQGQDYQHLFMIDEGRALYVDNWQKLLTAINPSVGSGAVKVEQVSPEPFTGYSFVWSTNSKAALYNTNLLAASDLPRRHADLTDPKYRGRIATSQFEDEWLYGPLYHSKEEWLRIVDGIGRNASAVLTFAAAQDRIVLGQIALASINSYGYWEVKDKNPSAPLGIHWWSDYTANSYVMYIIPKNSQHPAAATLWALWLTTPEAEEIWQRAVPYANISFGQSEISQREGKALKESGSPIVTWYDSPKNLDFFKWYSTDEGRAYRTQIIQGITQRQ
jgi:ABC-type Fe3+ transport system substrate-binding protein